jgi:cytochrome c556
MTTTLPRRRFFVTAGLGAAGALTVPAAFVSSQTPLRDEAVMQHIGKELARLSRLQRSRNLHAEHYETIAANLRLLAMVYPDVRDGGAQAAQAARPSPACPGGRGGAEALRHRYFR